MNKTRKVVVGVTVAVIMLAGVATAAELASKFNNVETFISTTAGKVRTWVSQVQTGVSNNGTSIVNLDGRIDTLETTGGPVGPAGPQGESGADGSDGAIGATGAAGTAGAFDIDSLTADQAEELVNKGFGWDGDHNSPALRHSGHRSLIDQNFDAIEHLSAGLADAFGTIDVTFTAPSIIE